MMYAKASIISSKLVSLQRKVNRRDRDKTVTWHHQDLLLPISYLISSKTSGSQISLLSQLWTCWWLPYLLEDHHPSFAGWPTTAKMRKNTSLFIKLQKCHNRLYSKQYSWVCYLIIFSPSNITIPFWNLCFVKSKF